MTTTPTRPKVSTPATPGNGSTASTAELVQRAADQVTRLVKDELALARAEMTQKGREAGLGVGMFGGSGVLVAYGVGALIAAAILGLAVVWPGWLAALVVAAGVFLLAGLFALVGRARLRRVGPPVPAEAVSSVKADMAQLKERTQR